MDIALGTTFKAAYFNKIKGNAVETHFWETLEYFLEDPDHDLLGTERLLNPHAGLHGYYIGDDLWAVFYFTDHKLPKAVLVDIQHRHVLTMEKIRSH